VAAALESLKDILPKTWASKKKRTSKGASVTDSNEAEDSGYRVEMQDSEDGEDDEDEEDADDEEEDTVDLPPRIIRPAHFNAAFEQVTATCSEDMESVQELRRWAAKLTTKPDASDHKEEDPVIAKVRLSGSLSEHEKRLLECVIDTSELSAVRIPRPIVV
jgi:hypothetical protein